MKKNKLLLEFSMGMPGVVVCGAAEGRGLGLDWTGLGHRWEGGDVGTYYN